MRPLGAMRLMRIGWSAVRMTARHGESRDAAQRRPGLGSMLIDLFLKKHCSADVAIFGAVAASGFALPGALLHEGVDILLARKILSRRRHVIEDLDEIEVWLAGTLVAVCEDIIVFDPALRFREVLLLAILSREIVGIGREVAVIDCDFGHIPEIAVRKRNLLRHGRNRERHRRRAERGNKNLTHIESPSGGSAPASASLRGTASPK